MPFITSRPVPSESSPIHYPPSHATQQSTDISKRHVATAVDREEEAFVQWPDTPEQKPSASLLDLELDGRHCSESISMTGKQESSALPQPLNQTQTVPGFGSHGNHDHA